MAATQRNLIIILTLAAALFMLQLDSTILNTSLKNIALDLKVDPNHLQITIVSYILTLAVFIPCSAFLADYFGTRKILALGIFLFTAGSLLCALSASLNDLVISRIIQGMGGSFIVPIARLAVVHFFPKNDLLKYNNYLLIPALTGQLAGPLVGGYLSQLFSWHWIFLINLPMGLLAFILTWLYLPSHFDRSHKLDWKGLIIFTLATVLISAGVQFYNKEAYFALTNRQNLLLIGIGILLFWVYNRYARKLSHAIFPLALFKIHTFKVGFIGNFFTRLGISALPVAIPLVLQVVFGFSAIHAGWMIFFMGMGALVSKIFMLPVIQRLGFKRAITLNTTLLGLLILGFVWLMNVTTADLYLSVYLFLLGVISSVQYTMVNTITLGDLPDPLKSSGATLTTINQQLSTGIGIALMSILLDDFNLYFNNQERTFTWSFITAGVITIIAGFIFYRLHENDGDQILSKNIEPVKTAAE